MRVVYHLHRIRTLIVIIVIATLPVVRASSAAAQMLATDHTGRLFVVNTMSGAGTYVCDLPTFGGLGSTEIEFNNSTGRGIVQGIDGAYMHQEFSPPGCTALGPPISNGWAFNGMEWVGSTLYGTGQTGCTDATLCTIDPRAGPHDVARSTSGGGVASATVSIRSTPWDTGPRNGPAWSAIRSGWLQTAGQARSPAQGPLNEPLKLLRP